MDINHTSHSLAFLSSICVGGTVGMGTRVPQTATHPIRTQGQGDCDNERDDIEIGTPKIPKKEKSFVVSCICFLDHQLMYLLLSGSMSCTSLLLRSARRALGNTGGKVTEAGDILGERARLCVYQAAASRRLCRFQRGEGRETERRAATTAYVDLHPTRLHCLGHFSGGPRPGQPVPPILCLLSHLTTAWRTLAQLRPSYSLLFS